MFIEATSEIASRIGGAIREAARATGASFDYLLRTAQRESKFDPEAKAGTSSASGLFQFIEQTWLETLKTSGPELGYGRYAESIVQTPSGQYVVPDAARRQEIMQLRNEPAAASAMAGAFTKRNTALLTERLGRKPTDGELYIAHFLGASGASQLISTAVSRPQAKAADVFPEAARANRNVFYRRGQARTIAQVYDLLVAKHNGAPTPAAIAIAQAAPVDGASAIPMRSAPANPTVAATAATVVPDTPALALQSEVFHGLFRTEQRGPVSSLVSELWGVKTAPLFERAPEVVPVAPARAPATPGRALGRPLDLFRFLRPEIQAQANRSA